MADWLGAENILSLNPTSLSSGAMTRLGGLFLLSGLQIRIENDFAKREALLGPMPHTQFLTPPPFDARNPAARGHRLWLWVSKKGDDTPLASCALRYYPDASLRDLFQDQQFWGAPPQWHEPHTMTWLGKAPLSDERKRFVYIGASWVSPQYHSHEMPRRMLRFAQALAVHEYSTDATFTLFDEFYSRALNVPLNDPGFGAWLGGLIWDWPGKLRRRLQLTKAAGPALIAPLLHLSRKDLVAI